MKKLLLGLLVSSVALSSTLIAKEGIEAYNKTRDRAFITKLIAEEKSQFVESDLLTDFDSQKFTVNIPAQKKTQMRSALQKQFPKEMHGQLDDLIKQMLTYQQKLFTYCIDGKTVGFVRLFFTNVMGMPGGTIGQIGVAKEHRCKGIGEKMLRHALAEFKKSQLPIITLTAPKGKSKLFEKVGFVKAQELGEYVVYVIQEAAQ